jgi:hypothetical protein
MDANTLGDLIVSRDKINQRIRELQKMAGAWTSDCDPMFRHEALTRAVQRGLLALDQHELEWLYQNPIALFTLHDEVNKASDAHIDTWGPPDKPSSEPELEGEYADLEDADEFEGPYEDAISFDTDGSEFWMPRIFADAKELWNNRPASQGQSEQDPMESSDQFRIAMLITEDPDVDSDGNQQ